MKKKSSTKDLGLVAMKDYFENKSIFAPLNYSYLKPKGLKIYTFHAGFKKFEDLLVIILINL